MGRKLASIQLISDIREHPNADRLLIARVLGWDVIISKEDNYQIGQKIVYFEIDSCLPVVPDYEFLRKSSYRNSPILGEVFRLKPIKLRGVISCGLILPIELCFKDCMPMNGVDGFEVGEDVTELLNVKKWEEPEIATSGDSSGKRPVWIEKSDETRIQSETGLLEEFRNLDYYITTKYDGSSHYIAVDENNQFHFGSHNLELKPIDKKGSFYDFIVENRLETKLKDIRMFFNCKTIYVIGEWCGPGIQKNNLKITKPQWFPFTVNIDGKRCDLYMTQEICRRLNISMVAVEEIDFDLPSKYPTIEALLERAKKNLCCVYPEKAEGIVIRPVNPIYSKILHKDLSMKVINNEYILNE